MNIKKRMKHFFKKRKKNTWKNKYDVGRGTYGEPTIRRWGDATTLKVGCFCSIANNVTIFLGGNHRTDWITTYPFPVFRENAKQIKGHPASHGNVIIGHDVWIGSGAVILSGVHIANGAVIGASAVVTKDVEPYTIVAGNPAQFVKTRFKKNDINILQELNWWNWNDTKIDAAMPFLLSGDVPALHAFSSRFDLSHKQEKTLR
ncbi:CatB-related O-acetyltransferase [Desulfocicer vacuolatum]|nr:CatB-related O-acetyltransferase [Desulfocicer vacuolatum]